MTKKDIVKNISDKTQLPQQVVKVVVQETFDSIINALATDKKIELRNFGVFKVRTRKGRLARNPRTGKEVPISDRNSITFRAGKEMLAKVQDQPALKQNVTTVNSNRSADSPMDSKKETKKGGRGLGK